MSEFILVHMNTILVYNMAEAIHAIGVKVAFLLFEVELSLPQFFEYNTKMFFVFFNGFGVDEYIV